MAEEPKKDLFDLDALADESMSGISDTFFQDDSDVPDEGEKYVVFEIKNQNFAIPADRVAEVVRMLPVTVITNIPSWFMGIANLRGDILSVIDLSALLNNGPANSSQKAKLVVLSSENSETHLAFKVDRLREIVVLSDDQIEESANETHRHFTGVASYKSDDLNVLDVPEIISSLALR